MRSNGVRVAAIEEDRAPVESVCRSHGELWCWCEMGSGRDGTDIRGGLLVCTGIREKSVLCESDAPVCTYFRKKIKESRGDRLPNASTELEHAKTKCLTCQPYIQHCTTAKNISMPWNTPGPQSSSGKKMWTYGSNEKGSTGLFSHSDLKGFGQTNTSKHFPYTERMLSTCLQALGASALRKSQILFGPQIEWKLNPSYFRQFRFNNARNELHFAG